MPPPKVQSTFNKIEANWPIITFLIEISDTVNTGSNSSRKIGMKTKAAGVLRIGGDKEIKTGLLTVEIRTQGLATHRMTQFAQGLGLNLANAFSGHIEQFADLF